MASAPHMARPPPAAPIAPGPANEIESLAALRAAGIEFRRGSAGGGNQVRQPYLRGIVPKDHHLQFPKTDHVHFYGFYIGNFPDLRDSEVDEICDIVNAA
jgi:CDP-6-deoxy-D-xylo-4-hexulose-3-dehydrase